MQNPPDADGRPVRHSCAAIGCKITLDPDRLMCAAHWRMIPRELQGKIYTAYALKKRNVPGASEDHYALVRRAVGIIREKENG